MKEYVQSDRFEADMQEEAREQYMQESYCEARACCTHCQMECTREGDFLYITTDAGKWYFKPQEGQITLYHKNYELRRNQAESYHVQFTREYSIRELIWYIYKHDRQKKRRTMKKTRGL